MDGRIGIKSEVQSGTASLFWRQQDSNYNLRIVAPFGQGTYLLSGTTDRVQMSGPDNLLLTAGSAEELMNIALGWSVNLQGLRYWVRGLPNPESEYSAMRLDNKGRLQSIKQAGFNIDFQRYAIYDDYELPEKILIKSSELQLKLLIKRWQI